MSTPLTPISAPKRSLGIRILRGLGWTLLGLLALLLLVFGALQTPWGKNVLRDFVSDILNDTFKGRVEIDRISGFLPFDLTLEGVRLFDPEGKEVIGLAELEAVFHPLDLLDKTVHLSKVLLRQPSVSLFDDEGRIGLLRALEPRNPVVEEPLVEDQTEASPWILAFDDIRLEGGELQRLLPGDPDLALGDLSLDLSLGMRPEGLFWPKLALKASPLGSSQLAELIGGDIILSTAGGMRNSNVELTHLILDAGPHRFIALGQVGFGEATTGKLSIEELRLDLDRLPTALKDELGPLDAPALLTGQGELELDASGQAIVTLGLHSQLAYILLEAGAKLDFSADAPSFLEDWTLHTHVMDLTFTPRMLAELPPEGRNKRYNLDLRAHGNQVPPGQSGDQGSLWVDLAITEDDAGKAVTGLGHVRVRRIRDARQDQAPSFLVNADLLDLSFQPWLQLAKEPELVGAIQSLTLSSFVSLPASGLPRVNASAQVELGVSGLLHATEPPTQLHADPLRAHAQLRWQGEGLPVGTVELTGKDLAFDQGRLKDLGLQLQLTRDAEQRTQAIADLSLKEGGWGDDIRAGALSLQASVDITETLTTGALPEGRIRWQAGQLAALDKRLSGTSGNLRLNQQANGLRITGQVGADGALIDRQLSLGGADLDVDVLLAPGPEAPVGGPIHGTISGQLRQFRQGPNSIAAATIQSLHVDVPLGPQGLSGYLGAKGQVLVRGIKTPQVTVERANATVDARVDLARLDVLGEVTLQGEQAELSNGQRVSTLTLEAQGVGGGKLLFEGRATQEGVEGQAPLEVLIGQSSLILPSGRRPLSAEVGKVSVAREGANRPLLLLNGARYTPQGWLEIEPLNISTGGADKGRIEILEGYFNPQTTEMRAHVLTNNLELKVWAEFIQDVYRWAGMQAPRDLKQSVNGMVSLSLLAQGRLDAPQIEVRLRGKDLSYSGTIPVPGAQTQPPSDSKSSKPLAEKPVTFDIMLDVTPKKVKADLSIRRGTNHLLALNGNIQTPLSLSPFVFDLGPQTSMSFSWVMREPDIAATAAELRHYFPELSLPQMGGHFEMRAMMSGAFEKPLVSLAMQVQELELLEQWKQGHFALNLVANKEETVLDLFLDNEESKRRSVTGPLIAQKAEIQANTTDPLPPGTTLKAPDSHLFSLNLKLPFALGDVWSQSKGEPQFASIQNALKSKPFSLEVVMPATELGKTPLVSLLPESLVAGIAEMDVVIGGTSLAPKAKGHIAFRAPDIIPMGLDTRIKLNTQANGPHTDIDVDLTLQRFSTNASLVTGELTIPRLNQLLENPESLSRLTTDENLRFALSSVELHATDLWDFQEATGDLMSQLFPDGWLSLYMSANGSPKGLQALAYARIRTTQSNSSKVRRNVADDVRLSLYSAEETELSLVLSQDTLVATTDTLKDGQLPLNTLSLKSKVDFSLTKLLDGTLPAWDQLSFEEGLLSAHSYQFGGHSTGLRSVLGDTEGTIDGLLQVSGKLGAPQFKHLPSPKPGQEDADSEKLSIHFTTLDVPPAGLVHKNVNVDLKFETPTSWSLTIPHIFNETMRARTEGQYCEMVPLPEAQNSVPYLVAKLTGTLPSLDPKQMALGGCIGLKDFQALNTKDLKGRVDGSLTFAGNVDRPQIRGTLSVVDAALSPSFASKSVRPIGTPMDVTLVRGAPKPPETREVKSPWQTGLTLDVTAKLAKDTIRVEPSISQPFGEVRALIFPHGQLRILTNAGELAITGIIEVPKERIYLYGKTFILDSDSRVTFLGDMATDPQLQFTARHNISSVDLSSIGLATNKESEVVVRVTGSASDPKLEFSSTPSMDETNILSVIALGIPAGGGEALGDAVQDQLLTAVMGMATMQFARDFQQRLALDVLRIEANGANPADTRLTVGKRLTEDIFLNYYLNLAAREGEDQQSGSLEYRLTRYLSLLGRAGDSGDVGLEINLRFQDTPPPPRNSRLPTRQLRPPTLTPTEETPATPASPAAEPAPSP